MTLPQFPGGTAVSGLEVYDWEAVDGRCGGSPHVHLVCTEAYVVVAGEGVLQTLTAAGPEEIRLRPGTVAWFAPGTVHRAVNTDGALRAVVVMQNSGLPEAGDAVLTFPPALLDDPDAYARLAAPQPLDAAAARRRRDLAVQGFLALVEGGRPALDAFYRRALALRRSGLDDWRARCEAGPLAAATATLDQLAALRRGDVGHLLAAATVVRDAPEPADRRYGMCGRLDTYQG